MIIPIDKRPNRLFCDQQCYEEFQRANVWGKNKKQDDFSFINLGEYGEEVKKCKNGVGYIYMLKYDNKVKIGHSYKLKNRLFGFSLHCPVKLDLVYLESNPNARLREKELHQRYKDKRLNAEWFSSDIFSDDLGD